MQKAFDLKEESKEKVKVTSLEIIVTGTKDKPYFEIKYKEVGEDFYHIGYSSYDLNNVLGWKEECFEIVNQVAEEYKSNDGWIPCSSGKIPADYGEDWVQIQIQESDTGYLWIPRTGEYRHDAWWVAGFDEDVRLKPPFEVIAWKPLTEQYDPRICINEECPYNEKKDCPAAEGCGGYEEM